MQTWLYDVIFPLGRWLHIVCTTLIVGGTLFFELVLPIAIEDLKREQQFYVFARARLVFRWVVWISVVGLLLSGTLSTVRMWESYQREEFIYVSRWAMAHIALSLVAMCIALLLTMGAQPPTNPVKWMRLNLVILLVAIFLASATRHFQLTVPERTTRQKVPDGNAEVPAKIPATRPVEPPATLPVTQPSTQPTVEPATQPATQPATGPATAPVVP